MIPSDFRTPANAALSRGQIALRLLTPTAIAKRALDNGTLKIERAENTQLMGTFKFYNLDLYRNGQYVGVMGASSGKLNDAFLDGLSAKGMRFGYGVINDQMFLMTWPAETPAAQES